MLINKNILSIVICLCIFANQAFSKIQWEEGINNFIKEKTNHDLESKQDVPRSLDVRVNFKKEFIDIPKVAITITNLLWASAQGQSFKVKLLEVDQKGFSYAVIVQTPNEFNAIDIKYLAFVDPHLQLETYEFKEFNINGDSDKSVSYHSIDFERTLKTPPNVAVFLLGAHWNHDGSQFDIQVDGTKVSEKGCEIEVSTYNNGNPYSVFVQVLVLPSDRSELFQAGGKSKNGSLRMRKSRTTDIKTQKVKVQFNPKLVEYLFWGITGFSSSYDTRFSVFVTGDKYKQKSGKFQIQIGAEGSSKLTHASLDVFSYLPQDDCAFLFSGCNFSGNGISICKDKSQDSFQGTHLETNDIRSIYIPEGETLTLFEDENLKGRSSTHNQSTECIEELKADK